ncbi:Gram-negative bacterial tonB protein [Rheinheimera sp. A13L]|uniref:energy transducer TonB n=1 Tax=Rheinheimera sp. A13L TaxID=506534 RepID=UPI00021250F5|nr:energy transducer TonB [Rheinheimera sp. A13L]EGM78474.1 Gram-negative bacterial tonB protein [Rheinheimera sp. A13L]
MYKSLLVSSLLFCGVAQADLLDALKYYEKKDYTKAQAEFASLVPLGNETAAFNLAVMYQEGQGVAVDLAKTQAYLQLAYSLGDKKSERLAKALYDQLPSSEQQRANATFEQLVSSVQINNPALDDEPERPMPEAISRKEPMYPMSAARRGEFGFADARFLIDEKGKVQGVEIINEYPKGTFDTATKNALSTWEYQATGQKHIGRVSLSYTLSGIALHKKRLDKLIKEQKLFDYALAGSPSHQYLLGSLLRLVNDHSHARLEEEPNKPFSPDFSLPAELFQQKYLAPKKLAGFKGHAKVSTDEKGKVTAVLESKPLSKTQVEALLLGQKLHVKAKAGQYSINTGIKNDGQVFIHKVLQVSPFYSSNYWLLTAAKNGHLEAQRLMAARSDEWENYMLQQNDAVIQTWAGVSRILKGEQEQGHVLLDKAIAQQYEVASELKAAL